MNTDFTQATLKKINLEGSNLTKAIFTGTILTDANLKFADLKSSNLYWVHLTNSEFFKADLQGVISGNIEGVPKSLPDEWVIKYGTLINEEWGSSNPPDKVLSNE